MEAKEFLNKLGEIIAKDKMDNKSFAEVSKNLTTLAGTNGKGCARLTIVMICLACMNLKAKSFSLEWEYIATELVPVIKVTMEDNKEIPITNMDQPDTQNPENPVDSLEP